MDELPGHLVWFDWVLVLGDLLITHGIKVGEVVQLRLFLCLFTF